MQADYSPNGRDIRGVYGQLMLRHSSNPTQRLKIHNKITKITNKKKKKQKKRKKQKQNLTKAEINVVMSNNLSCQKT